MDCSGLDLVHPLDRQPAGAFPFLQNVRVTDEGRIEGRPGYTLYDSAAVSWHSMRRLNDEDMSEAPTGYIDVLGGGTQVWAGPQGALNPISSGFSGSPLSILTFRPDQASESWAYVYDANKSIKVNPAKVVKQIGLPPPQAPLDLEYGRPNSILIDDGQDASVWTASGSGTGPSTQNRASTNLINAILYNSGTTGWCCIVPGGFVTPSGMVADDMGNRMGLVMATATEEVLIREVHPSITGTRVFNAGGTPSTTIAGISYDSGSTGACTIVLASPPEGGDYTLLARNSVLWLDPGAGASEQVRVLSVSLAPDGVTYSFRCVATTTHVAGATVIGLVSFYCYTLNHHSAGESYSSNYVRVTSTGAGGGNILITNTTPVNASLAVANARPISPANDYMHISLTGGTPSNISYVLLNIYLGGTGSGVTSSYYQFTIPGSSLPSAWNEITIPFSQAIFYGSTPSLANISAISITFQQTDPTAVQNVGFDWWYIFGTYGPDVPPNSPVGLSYESRNRDSTTGVASVPGPPARHQVFPQREQILIKPDTSTATEVDSLDIFRLGNTLSDFTYVGTVVNNTGSPNTYSDSLPDSQIDGNPIADVTLLQPWPTLELPWSGVVNVVGTNVTWVSGTQFNTKLVNGTVILLNGTAYQVYGQPSSATRLQIFNSGGVQTNATFAVASPLIAASPLPFAFGPLEGPLAPVGFGLGNLISPGTLYYTNTANLDAASDKNTIEVAGPSEPLVSGGVWNGFVFVGSRENLYVAQYSFLQTLGVPGQTTFQFKRVPSPSGMWSRWACCAGQDGLYYLGRDGIYRATESGAVSVTDERLYPLFPHDGQAAKATNGMLPVDMTQLSALRLSAADQDIYFDYATVGS